MDDRAAPVQVSGPLAEHAEGFRAMLAGRGYAPSSAAGLLQVMAHLSRWLTQQDRPVGDLAAAVVGRLVPAGKEGRWLPAVAFCAWHRAAAGIPGECRAGGTGRAGAGRWRAHRVSGVPADRAGAGRLDRPELNAAGLLAAWVRLESLTASAPRARCRAR